MNCKVNAAVEGRVQIWDMDDNTLCARTIFSAEWLSPPLSVAFCGSEQC